MKSSKPSSNSPKPKIDFRKTCIMHKDKISTSNQPTSQEYQENFNHYHKITSIYLTKTDCYPKTKLIIYDTESERKGVKILDTPTTLNWSTSITQLPNGELFCYGTYPMYGTALIIDRNLEIRALPSGIPCFYSSTVYFNSSVYCFGGSERNGDYLNSSRKFDLNENRWINLTPMPKNDNSYLSVSFNRNILISGWKNIYLLLYSTEIDSYSTIPYEFAKKRRKILINAEKLYVIVCDDYGIYESEDEYNWKKISESTIKNYDICQVYCSYNKEGVYIGVGFYIIGHGKEYYEFYKFDLKQKVIVELKERRLI